MSNHNDFNDPDKRLKQDNIEQEKKANASTGMFWASTIILIGIIAALYFFYNRTPVEPQNINQENVVPAATVATPTEPTPAGTTNTTVPASPATQP